MMVALLFTKSNAGLSGVEDLPLKMTFENTKCVEVK